MPTRKILSRWTRLWAPAEEWPRGDRKRDREEREGLGGGAALPGSELAQRTSLAHLKSTPAPARVSGQWGNYTSPPLNLPFLAASW